MKKFFWVIIFVFIVGTVMFYRDYSDALRYARNPSSDARVVIDVPRGSTADDIADLLEEKGLIKSSFIFKMYLNRNELAGDLKAGRLIVQENMTLPQLAKALVDGKSEEFSITLLEGWTASEIADYIASTGITTAESFKKCLETCEFDYDFLPNGSLEGYLYPDTYFINLATYSDERFIGRLINNLQIHLTDEDLATIEASDYDLYQIITMASIIEREERNEDEQPTVAGILWKRFDNDIGLGADATILYGLGRTKGGLTYDDLQLDSPYNTRKYRGLPPTPISNPGISSIRAAIYPKKSPYLYYLHDSDGNVHYATTLEDHNLNKARYIQ